MAKIHYHCALLAGFCLCCLTALPPLRAKALSGAAAEPAAAKQEQPSKAGARRAPQAAGCERLIFEGNSYAVCRADPSEGTLRLFLADAAGRPYNYFRNVRSALAEQGQKALFLMNAGMYHPDYRPVGLYVERGKQLFPANRQSGKGNFFMKPNGIFYLTGHKAGVMETEAYLRAGIKPLYATQSGPMLALSGAINRKFIKNSSFKEYRNGAGVTARGEAVFAISEGKVNFYDFARLFLYGLHCPNALFLDGSISSLYAPELSRADWFYPMGPIIGSVSEKE